MPKGTPSLCDGYLNDLGEHHAEIMLALERMTAARNEVIVILACGVELPGVES